MTSRSTVIIMLHVSAIILKNISGERHASKQNFITTIACNVTIFTTTAGASLRPVTTNDWPHAATNKPPLYE